LPQGPKALSLSSPKVGAPPAYLSYGRRKRILKKEKVEENKDL
jgi:hypothetical protein